MEKKNSELKRFRRVGDIVNSFLSEGYVLRIRSNSVALIFVKLQHQRNGNCITIKATEKDISIYKNQKRVHYETCNYN